MVSSKRSAFLEGGYSTVPGSGRKSEFSSSVLWHGERLALAKKKTLKFVLNMRKKL